MLYSPIFRPDDCQKKIKTKKMRNTLALVAAFQRFVDRVSTGLDADEVFEELVSIRADFRSSSCF